MPFFVSPSKLARYFYHDCERQLKAALGAPEQLKVWGVTASVKDANPVVALLQDSGYDWEEEVVGQMLDGQARIAPGEGSLSERAFTPAQTLEQLAGLGEGEWLYQPTLVPTEAFNHRYKLDPTLVRFATCRPDLLRVHNGKLQVIDVKASDALKSSHRVQVAFYALLLEEALARVDTPLRVDREQGYIWLYKREEPTSFPLAPTIAILEGFLSGELTRILEADYQDAFWHLTPRCEWCELFAQCNAEARAKHSVSLIPFLSGGAVRYLKESAGVETLDQLQTLLEKGNADEHLRGCGSLFGRARRLRTSADALKCEQVKPHGGSTLRLPIREDVRIILSAQKEPVSGRTYLAAFERTGGSDVYPQASNVAIFIAEHPDDCLRVRKDFLEALFDELYALHKFNSDKPWETQRSLQLYAFDSYEILLFEDLLFAHLADPETSRQAMQLMLFFQNESLTQSKVHPVQEIAHPLVNVVQIIRELMALPQPLMIHLQRSSVDLSGGDPMPFDPKFHYELNNAMKAGPILRAWREPPAKGLGRISREMRKRLRSTAELIDATRRKMEGRLFAWPRKFLFPNFGNFRHRELSQLEFVIRYECFTRALEIRESRSRPLIERVRSGNAVSLKKADDDNWILQSALDSSHFDDGGGFFCFLLAPTGAEGERAQMSFDDYRHRSAFSIQSSGGLRLAKVLATTIDPETGLVTTMRLELKPNDPIPSGGRFHLHPRFTDFNSDKQVEQMRVTDQDSNSLLVGLLQAPHQLGAPWPTVQPNALTQLTESQQSAWKHLCSNRLTLVWGPPGTGKTHFLSTAITQLRRQPEPLQIVVTAFTHSAIEHLLEKIAETDPELPVRKLQDLRKPSQLVQGIDPKQARKQPPATVIGATVYALRRAMKAGFPQVDVLVVDEGSQMKWGELSLALSVLKPTGRLVIAGDDLQLPPILAGRYPVPEDGRPGLEDSVFAYLRSRDDATHPFTCQLTENWRMHERLSDFAARTLYGEAYRPATPEIGSRRLSVAKTEHWLWPLLDPAFPLVLCILEDVQAAQENVVEAGLVAELSHLLRQLTPEEISDQTFWKERLFVVSPHHLQIRAIHKELHQQREWSSMPFVDTVDKMQGQEAQTVIVSYGVSDRETALQEAAFIYSLNRLNVAITRAQAKCIVFLPRPLLHPSFEVLDDEKAVLGLGHMSALLAYCQTYGQQLNLTKGPKMSVWRA